MNEAGVSRIGRYRVLGVLGRGAMGTVYRAADEMLDREVAIKTINMSDDPAERAELEARFLQEAKATAGLGHPNVVTVYDIGREADTLYLAMELVAGEELRDVLGRRRPSPEEAVAVAAQIAEGLAAAHDRGIVHRDIKPSNVMVLANGTAKIMDFGIARLRAADVRTQTGLRLGSPRYMAPEQVLGKPVDHRADLFALGVVLYEMLTGVQPFGGDDLGVIMAKVATAEPPAPSEANPDVPAMLDLVVAKAMAKDPERRYQEARELAADLRAAMPGAAPAAPATRPAAPRVGATATRPLPRPDLAAETGPRFPVSRRFDSAAALQALAESTGSTGLLANFTGTLKLDAAGRHGTARRKPAKARRARRANPMSWLAAGLVVAGLVALAIALT